MSHNSSYLLACVLGLKAPKPQGLVKRKQRAAHHVYVMQGDLCMAALAQKHTFAPSCQAGDWCIRGSMHLSECYLSIFLASSLRLLVLQVYRRKRDYDITPKTLREAVDEFYTRDERTRRQVLDSCKKLSC